MSDILENPAHHFWISSPGNMAWVWAISYYLDCRAAREWHIYEMRRTPPVKGKKRDKYFGRVWEKDELGFVLRHYHKDMSASQISKVLGRSKGAVESAYYKYNKKRLLL